MQLLTPPATHGTAYAPRSGASLRYAPIPGFHRSDVRRGGITWAGLPPAGPHQLAAGALIQSPHQPAPETTLVRGPQRLDHQFQFTSSWGPPRISADRVHVE